MTLSAPTLWRELEREGGREGAREGGREEGAREGGKGRKEGWSMTRACEAGREGAIKGSS